MAETSKLGAVYAPDKTTFSVYSSHAKNIELCIFSDDEDTEIKLSMEKGDDDIWRATIPNLKVGQKYGYRVHGDYNPEQGLFFNPNKLAVDPYCFDVSKEISDWDAEALCVDNNLDSALYVPKSIVVERNDLKDSQKYPYLKQRPKIPWGKNVIYETHVRNFTLQNFNIPEQERGKLIAFTNPKILDYLEELGVNNIEFLPITPTCPGRNIDKSQGLTDNWGYNPYCHFAINPRYGTHEDLKAVINAFHSRGIKLTLDVVFNHTGEYEAQGYYNRALSYKLLDSPSYYQSNGDDKSNYANYTGCGNNFNLNTYAGQKLLHDYIDYIYEIGVDGLRFDLGGDNALNQYGQFLDNGGFMQEIRYAREVLNLDISIEPWSALGGNYSARFSGQIKGVKEWSDRRHKFDARFFSSHGGLQGEFATQVAGSALIDPQEQSSAVIGTGRTHDGFSLLGAFEHHKDTSPNGEGGRDGSHDEYRKSANRDELYRRAISNAAFDILSKGVPFMRAGDERGYSSPNNNPYCIDDKSVWIDWKSLSEDNKKLFLNIRKLHALRQKHPVFNNLKLFTGEVVAQNGVKDIVWLRPDAQEMEPQDWNTPYAKTGAYLLNGSSPQAGGNDDDFMIMVSGDDYYTVDYKLPKPPSGTDWQLVFDSSQHGFVKDEHFYKSGDIYALKPFSFVILKHNRQTGISNQKQNITMFNKKINSGHDYY